MNEKKQTSQKPLPVLIKGEENGNLEQLISTIPIVLDTEDNDVRKAGRYYLPFSTGFEIETFQSKKFDVTNFTNIPNILHVQVDNDEQRFRIPKGIEGLICLFNISSQLKKNSLLDLQSGIHYHVDFTKYFDNVDDNFIEENENWILTELETWDYKGTYNSKRVSFHRCWVRFHQGYKTIEFRIGEMTFDYELLFKRIVHINKIVKKLVPLSIRYKAIKDDPCSQYSNIKETLKNRKQILDL